MSEHKKNNYRERFNIIAEHYPEFQTIVQDTDDLNKLELRYQNIIKKIKKINSYEINTSC